MSNIFCAEYVNCEGCPNVAQRCILKRYKDKAREYQQLRDRLEWNIKCIMGKYAKRVNKAERRSDIDELKKVYADAVLLNIHIGYGLAMPIDDFYDEVKGGGLIDSDGMAELYDKDGMLMKVPCYCKLSVIKEAKAAGGVFVVWYNK